MVQTIMLYLGRDGRTTVQISNHSNENWKIHEGEMIGCLYMRSSGYFHVSRETLQHIIQSSFKDKCSFLSERETEEYFDLYHKDHNEVMNYVSAQVNQRLKQQQGNTELVDRNKSDDDTDVLLKGKSGKGKILILVIYWYQCILCLSTAMHWTWFFYGAK